MQFTDSIVPTRIIMKILLPITLLILASTATYGAFNSNGKGSGYSRGYKTDVQNGGYRYNTDHSRDDFYGNDFDDDNTGSPPNGNNTSKAASPAPATAATKEKAVNPATVAPKSNPDAGKKIQKVTRGDVVAYEWATPQQAKQVVAEADTQVEIITVGKSGFGASSDSNKEQTSTCKVQNMGVNIEGVKYYSQGMPFNDLSKMSLGWIRSWGSSWEDIPLDLDENGYLKTVDAGKAQTILSDDLWGRDKDDKRYVILYDGEGELVFNLIKAKIIKSEPGRIEIELKKGRAGMSQISTNPSNYLRNIRIIPKKHEDSYQKNLVGELFADTWENMKVFRYLNLQKINSSTETAWQDRKKPHTFGAKGGQSIEDIIQMSNTTNTNPWLLAPHMANDDYFRNMAIYVRDNLNPDLKVYIEYTNEAWNWQFTQTKYLSGLEKKNGTPRHQEYGKRAKRLFDIWLDVFGNTDRIVRVVGTQFANPWVSEQIMKTPGLAGSVDVLAVGYYIGHELGQEKMALRTLEMSNEEVFDYLSQQSFPKAKEYLIGQKKVADDYDLELVAYEAGQHIVAHGTHPTLGTLVDNKALTAKLISLNRDARMEQFYMDMYDQWNEVGGGLITWFATTDKVDNWGSWGILEHAGQDPNTAPKYQAIQRMIADQGC